MMSCSCRTTSLKIFVQSLTELRISNSARQIQPQYSRVGNFRSRFTFARPYSVTAALSFPRKVLQGRASHSLDTDKPSKVAPQKRSDDATVEEPDVPVLNVSADILDRAKSEGAILDFTPESIDALVSNLDNPQTGAPGRRDKHAQSDSRRESKSDSTPPVETKRLKRLKIMKDEPKASTLPPIKKEPWKIQKEILKEKFPEGWQPRKRLSPDALEGIRALHAQFPEDYTTEVLANKFMVSPEAIRRILRTKWMPTPEEEIDRQQRWFNRGKNIWSQMAALGKKPPRKWRREGIVRDPSWNRPRGPRTQPPRQSRKYRGFE
ncbi:Required for respiratory growth protein 9, mitochondrial [Daldinia childiae]|uniref:Required for respiratory growth protein 9, mitochondrial n=1 Tax=Daldinia childiae TaxID=326645 RepID=UPI001446D42E|nr:Required for respiratory growth protein 9, mitochondrial [Daldinia childiae]KAF3070918.1 Required for respiratory growth protein 9, mitochondrial [Daldinia childiae]